MAAVESPKSHKGHASFQPHPNNPFQ